MVGPTWRSCVDLQSPQPHDRDRAGQGSSSDISMWLFTLVLILGILFATETREELYYDKARLLANGDRWEREIAMRLKLDAPYQ